MQTFVSKLSGWNLLIDKTKINLIRFCLLVALYALSNSTANAQTITLSSANPAISEGSLSVGVNSQIIYKATIALTGSGYGVNFNGLTFTANGTFTTSDIYYASGNNGYKVWLNNTDNFSSANSVSNPVSASAPGSVVNITVNSPWLSVGTTYYMWITADISASATPGHTLTVAALSTSSFSFNGGSKKGTLYAGGTQTVSPPKQYRSKTSGNWNSTGTWEQSVDEGATWTNATSTPTSADGAITIQNGHTVTVTSSISTDETTVNTGGQITVNSGVTLTIADGAGTDLNVNGTIANKGTISTTGTVAFNGGSTYQHIQNGGTIPTATWDTASNCTVLGVTYSAPGGVNQEFGNFTWSSSQTAYVSLSPSSMSIQGNLQITDTGNPYDFAIEQNITIGGNLIVTGGTYRVTYSYSRSHTIKGDLIITGGTLDLNSGSGTPTSNIFLSGNLTISGGTLTESGNGSGNITFNGSNIQTFSKTGGTINKKVNFSVSSGSTLDVGTSILTGAGSFTLSSGAGIITANTQGISTTASTGSIQVSGNRTYSSGANYTYNGTVTQITGNGLNSHNPANLSINNSAGVTLSGATSISGALYLLNGNLTTTTTNILTLTNTNSNAISGGSATSFIDGPVKWNLPSSMSSGFTYNVPLGSNTTYLPFALVNPVTGSNPPAVTIQAFAGNFTASTGTGLSSVSKTEYWSLKASNTYLTSSSFSLGRSPSVFPYDAIGYSNSTSYSSINGTPDPYFIRLSDSKTIGTTATRYFALGVSSSTTPEILTSEQSLTGFTYVYDQGPSVEQSFAIDGTKLTGNITITPPTNFEISTKSGIEYQSTAITLTQSGGNVPLDTIFVRLKAGLAVGTYNSESISITSGSLSKTIICNGNVTLTATSITASGDYNCSTGTISLSSTTSGYISNVYWLGPNNYYSNSANPAIPSATSVNSGTYTAYGSILSGLNLITNGDFESGNSGFTSSYSYQTPNGDHTVWGEGTYTIAANPHAVHANFSSCPDHTIGGSTPTGNQMIINGAGTSNVTIWSQTVSVSSNTNYQFTYWLQSVISDSPSQLQLYVNGVAAGPVYTASTTTCTYNQYFYNWNSGTATTAILSLVNQNTASSGNDFTIDDIVFQPVTQISSSVNISTTNTDPFVSISPSATSVDAGSTVTYTASPTNSGNAPTYQWKVNGANAGTNSPVFTYVPSAGDIVTCEMTSNGTCSNGVKVTSNQVTVTVNARKNYWIGGTSTEWNLASNWSDHVPNSGEDIVFASTNTKIGYTTETVRDLILDANRTVGKLKILSTSIRSLIIPAGKCLTVNDSIVTLNNNPDLIHLQASPTAESGSLIILGKTNPVNATVEMYSKASWNLSAATNYKYKWQFFGIPVKSVTASPTFDGSYVRRYDESGTTISNHWIQLSNNSVMTPFTGYELTQSEALTYTIKGQLLNNDTTLQLKYTAGALYPGQNIISNPYAGAINISKIIFGSETESTVYIYNTGTFKEWESNGQSQSDTVTTTAGQYLAVPQSVAGTGTIPAQIPSTQAFLVKAKSNSPNATITLNYSNVIVRNKEQKRVKAADATVSTDKSYLQVNVKGTKRSDTMWLFDEISCSHDYDNGWDGYKFFGSTLSPQLFANENEVYYQIDASDNLTDTYIGFQPGEDSEYTLTFNAVNLSGKYKKLYLTDLVENQTISLLNEGTVYKFSASNTSLNSKRFKITGDKLSTPSVFKIYAASDILFIDNTSDLPGKLYLYDLTGKCKMIHSFQANAVSSYEAALPKGFYIIKAVTEKNTEEKKIYISGF